MPVPAATGRLDLPSVRGDESRPLVVIDAGHGGHDPGAISPDTGLQEKDVTLKIAKAIRDELVKSGRVRVALTRSDDRRSEEHTSELQSLMRNSYAVFCMKKKTNNK